MASTTDPNKPGTGLHGEGRLDELTDTGGPDSYATDDRHGIVTGDFDREINVRAILWSGFWLAVVTIAANILMWWFLKGFKFYDEHHEVPVMPMAAQNEKTPPPPGPLLQPENPAEDRNKDMVDFRRQEDQQLGHASQAGNTLRVPVDVAIDVIARRGVQPFPATGAPATAVQAPQSPEAAPNPVTTPSAAPPSAAKPPAR
jgi:hypothetical protein